MHFVIKMKFISVFHKNLIEHPFKLAGNVFSAFSIIFTLMKMITHFSTAKLEGPYALMTFVVISICVALKKAWKPSNVRIRIPNNDTTIEIAFGNLFDQQGIRAIGVNDFFDSKIGNPVSAKSLHGIFLQKCFGGYSEPFDSHINEELKHSTHNEHARTEGKIKSYPIGTTALIPVNQDRYIVFALSKTHPETHKAYSDIEMLWTALNKLWQRARIISGGDAINIPLIGSGLSGIGLPARDLLNLIILSIINETKLKEIAKTIRIILHPDRFNDIDLREVKESWEKK